MFTAQYQIQTPNAARSGQLTLTGGAWIGDECVFEFCENLYGMHGTIRCDWRKPGPNIDVLEGPSDLPEAREILQKITDLLPGYHSGAFAGITTEQIKDLYRGDYHRGNGYTQTTENEQRIKGHLADLVIDLARPRKVLVAGCAAGECIRQFRNRGIEAWGFDICDDLQSIAYPEARPYLRVGSVEQIPFGPEDGFDTITAMDLFEHIPEDRVPGMVRELDRLNVTNVAAMIALAEFQYEGHITLRPLHWWDQQMAPAFTREAFTNNANHPSRGMTPGVADPARMVRLYQKQAAACAV